MNSDELRDELETLHPASYQWSLVCCRGDVHLAKEMLQASYVKILAGPGQFRAESSVKTWVFGIIRNTVRESLRKERVRRAAFQRWAQRSAQPTETQASSSAIETDEQTAALRIAVEGLSARQRQIVHLVFYEALTIESAAAVMQITVGSARTHYERAKRRLRETLPSTTLAERV